MVKNLLANVRDTRNMGLIPGLGRCPWKRKWQPTPVFFACKITGTEELGRLQFMGQKK